MRLPLRTLSSSLPSQRASAIPAVQVVSPVVPSLEYQYLDIYLPINQCLGSGSAYFGPPGSGSVSQRYGYQIRLWILLFSNKGVERTEIMLAN
jgi:hypothetical protein